MADLQYLSPIDPISALDNPWSLGGVQTDGGESFENKVGPESTPSNGIAQQATDLLWMVSLRDKSIESVTGKLLRDGWHAFKQVRLEDWVEYVMGMASETIAGFVSYHDRLSFSLFDLLCYFPSESDKYQNVQKVGN